MSRDESKVNYETIRNWLLEISWAKDVCTHLLSSINHILGQIKEVYEIVTLNNFYRLSGLDQLPNSCFQKAH